MKRRAFSQFLALAITAFPLFGLDPNKALSQYTRTIWTQADGLPQDSIRAIAQTTDGYLWLGTTEGLARFDGYEFVAYTKNGGHLPGNSVISILPARDGTLWIGTSEGIATYKDGKFSTFPEADGFPRRPINCVLEDHNGTIWVVSGGALSRMVNGKLHTYPAEDLAPIDSVRIVYEDAERQLWVGGVSGVVKKDGDRFTEVLGPSQLGDSVITSILRDKDGLWLSGNSQGLFQLKSDGSLKHYTVNEGLPNNLVLEILQDRSGNIWVGTYGGLSRFEKGRFAGPLVNEKRDRDWVWSLFEDREGALWMGTNNSLTRLRDDEFTMFGRPEGLPSDEPMAVHQDRRGQLWIAYRDSGLAAFQPGRSRVYTDRDGLPSNEIYSIRDARSGGLLIATMGGISRFRDGRFTNYKVPDPAGRPAVHDVLEDSKGVLWAATPSGVYTHRDGQWRAAVPADSNPSNYAVVLAEGPDGTLWAGNLVNGLWKLSDPRNLSAEPRLFTTADGLGGNQIRSLMWDTEGTLWVGSFGGGITGFWDGRWHAFGAANGLLSDNVSHIEDDGRGDLWLSTTRGICRVSKQELRDFAAGKIAQLNPRNYGTADGLRSAQAAAAFPSAGGGTRTKDGRLWFTTGNGVATIDPSAGVPGRVKQGAPPMTRILGITADGAELDFSKPARLDPDTSRVEFRYVGVYLSAPETVRYSYMLEGLEPRWIPADDRRLASYSSLPHGNYKFRVRAEQPGGSSEASYAFEIRPHFYETRTFLVIAILSVLAGIYGVYRLRLEQIHSRFSAVFQERARLAREIHDTLAQGFVGISHQLDALASKLDGDPAVARQHLDLARRMTRHSLTEARRSMLDLRMSELQGQALSRALATAAPRWVAGTQVGVQLQVEDIPQELSEDLEQNLFRIAQEAVANAVKHARAKMISLELAAENHLVRLRISDNGEGFDTTGAFSRAGGHFGILGMRERAERFGGTFALASEAGSGTQVEVTIPLANKNGRH